jgi:uncharacterized membrane protein
MDTVIAVVRGTLDQLGRNIAGHALVGVLMAVATFFLIGVVFASMIAVPLVLGTLPSDARLPALLGLVGGGGVCFFVSLVPFMLLQAGYLRACIREADGGGLVTVGGVFADTRAVAGRALATQLIVGLLVSVGLLFCYLPGLVIGVATWHTSGLVVAGGRSPTEAITESVQSLRADPARHLLLMLGLLFVALISSWIPLLGVVIAPVVGAVYSARAWRVVFPDTGAVPAVV